MDDRQQQVKIGAGLEESRINQELIDWLNKWGMRILIVILVIVAGYQGTRFLEVRAQNARAEVFAEYYQLVDFNNPGPVLEFGETHRDQPGVWEMASMQGALMLLSEGTSGVVLGAVNRFAPTEDEKLTREEREQRYTRAAEVFQELADETADDPAQRMIHMQAINGRASALLSLGNYDEARTLLDRVIELGSEGGYDDLVAFAQARLGYWDDLRSAPEIVSREAMPVTANPVVPPDFVPSDMAEPLRLDTPKENDEPASDQPNVPVRTVDPNAPGGDEPASDDPVDPTDPGDGG